MSVVYFLLLFSSLYNVSRETTTSSSAAFPALSPIPFIVPWKRLAPPSIADNVLATARPKSLWQCALIGTPKSVRLLKKLNDFNGVSIPNVSQGHILSAPASIVALNILLKYSMSVLVESSAANSTTKPWSLAYSVTLTASLSISS